MDPDVPDGVRAVRVAGCRLTGAPATVMVLVGVAGLVARICALVPVPAEAGAVRPLASLMVVMRSVIDVRCRWWCW